MKKLLLSTLLAFFILPFVISSASAQKLTNTPDLSSSSAGLDVSFSTDIVEVPCDSTNTAGAKCYTIPWIGEYINAAYEFLVVVIGIVVVAVFTYAGVLYITAAGNASTIGRAKTLMTDAVIGLVLLLSSVAILNLINPNLVSTKGVVVRKVPFQESPHAAEGRTVTELWNNAMLLASSAQADADANLGRSEELDLLWNNARNKWTEKSNYIKRVIIPSIIINIDAEKTAKSQPSQANRNAATEARARIIRATSTFVFFSAIVASEQAIEATWDSESDKSQSLDYLSKARKAIDEAQEGTDAWLTKN